MTKNEFVRILIVDDDPVLCALATKIVVRMGYSVDIARSGKEAVELTQRQEYALILMDVNMPLMSGLKATQKIRKTPNFSKDIPIIAVTGEEDESVLNDLLDAGVNDFVKKPYKTGHLRELIEKWVLQDPQD